MPPLEGGYPVTRAASWTPEYGGARVIPGVGVTPSVTRSATPGTPGQQSKDWRQKTADQIHAEARSRRGTREMLALVSKVDNDAAPKTFDDPSPEPEGRKSSKIWRHRSTPPVVMSTPTQKRAMMSPSRAAKEAAAQREKEMKAWISGDPWSRDARGLL